MQTDKINTIVKELLEKTSFHVEEVSSVFNADDGSMWFSVKTNEPHLFLGREGESLMALNHLAKKLIDGAAVEGEVMPDVTIDVNEYQKKKNDNLKTIAHMMAERAKFFKSSVEIDPMSAYERKVVHTFLQNVPNIKTESVGEGRDRRVVVKYIEQ